jgi:hypothetical protein
MAGRQQQQNDPAYLDEHHQRISEFAADYFDDDDERDTFVGTLMERRGYKRVQHTSWDPPDPDPKNKGQGGGQGGGGNRPAYFKR